MPLAPAVFAHQIVRLALRLATRDTGPVYPVRGYTRVHRGLRLFAFWWHQAIRRHALAASLSGGSVT